MTYYCESSMFQWGLSFVWTYSCSVMPVPHRKGRKMLEILTLDQFQHRPESNSVWPLFWNCLIFLYYIWKQILSNAFSQSIVLSQDMSSDIYNQLLFLFGLLNFCIYISCQLKESSIYTIIGTNLRKLIYATYFPLPFSVVYIDIQN